MIQPISFFVDGEPEPQPRPRARAQKMGAKWVAQIYNPKDADGWKKRVASAAVPLIGAAITCPVSLGIIFTMPRPKSHYRSGRFSNVLRDDAPTWHVGTPDFDNLAKAVCDALTQCGLWKDDGQVCHTRIAKMYGERIGAEVTIRELV